MDDVDDLGLGQRLERLAPQVDEKQAAAVFSSAVAGRRRRRRIAAGGAATGIAGASFIALALMFGPDRIEKGTVEFAGAPVETSQPTTTALSAPVSAPRPEQPVPIVPDSTATPPTVVTTVAPEPTAGEAAGVGDDVDDGGTPGPAVSLTPPSSQPTVAPGIDASDESTEAAPSRPASPDLGEPDSNGLAHDARRPRVEPEHVSISLAAPLSADGVWPADPGLVDIAGSVAVPTGMSANPLIAGSLDLGPVEAGGNRSAVLVFSAETGPISVDSCEAVAVVAESRSAGWDGQWWSGDPDGLLTALSSGANQASTLALTGELSACSPGARLALAGSTVEVPFVLPAVGGGFADAGVGVTVRLVLASASGPVDVVASSEITVAADPTATAAIAALVASDELVAAVESVDASATPGTAALGITWWGGDGEWRLRITGPDGRAELVVLDGEVTLI